MELAKPVNGAVTSRLAINRTKVPRKSNNTMCDLNQNRALDEQRMIYVYQGLNVAMRLLSQYLDSVNGINQPPVDNSLTQTLKGADIKEVLAFSYQAMKNGKLTRQQYEEIFDIAMGTDTVKTTAKAEPSWNREYKEANAYLNQFRGV